MLEYFGYFLLFLLALWVLEKIPGLHLLVSPVMDALIKIVHWLSISSFEYSVWLIKRTYLSHRILFMHLTSRRKDISAKEEVVEREKRL